MIPINNAFQAGNQNNVAQDQELLKSFAKEIVIKASKDGKTKVVGKHTATIELFPEYATTIDSIYNIMYIQSGALGVNAEKYRFMSIDELEKLFTDDFYATTKRLSSGINNQKEIFENIIKTLSYLSKQINYKFINADYKDKENKVIEIKINGENAFVLSLLASSLLFQMALSSSKDENIKEDLSIIEAIKDDRNKAEGGAINFKSPVSAIAFSLLIIVQNFWADAEREGHIKEIDTSDIMSVIEQSK